MEKLRVKNMIFNQVSFLLFYFFTFLTVYLPSRSPSHTHSFTHTFIHVPLQTNVGTPVHSSGQFSLYLSPLFLVRRLLARSSGVASIHVKQNNERERDLSVTGHSLALYRFSS